MIPDIERRTGARFEYVPVLLGGVFKLTNNRSPAESLVGIRNKSEYQRLETARFVARHGITRFTANPFFPVNTLVLMRGAVAARKLGVFERYVDEIYRHMWADPKKMDDPDVVRAALAESDLLDESLLALAQSTDVKNELLLNTQRSVERGTFRLADVLRRRRDLLREGSATRCRRGDCGGWRSLGPRRLTWMIWPLRQCPNAWTISSVIFFASPNSIIVLGRKNSSLSTPA